MPIPPRSRSTVSLRRLCSAKSISNVRKEGHAMSLFAKDMEMSMHLMLQIKRSKV